MATELSNEDLINIGIDKYDIEEEWINNIASKYLDVDNINHLKVGLYGYLNEVMATSVRSSINHRNFLYDEAFLNTASMTKSIYNKAKSYNYDIQMATPASMNILLSIPQSFILEYGEPEIDEVTGAENGNVSFTLDCENKFNLSGFTFLAEADIVITARRSKMVVSKGSSDYTYAYSAVYDYSKCKDKKGIFSGNSSPYISTWVDRDTELDDIVTLQITIYQVTKKTISFDNFSSDLSDNLFFNIDYKNNLSKFVVTYTTQDDEIVLSNYFNDAFTPDEEYYCYYSFDTNILTIYFSGLPDNFKPAINSTLTVDVYTTLGTKGNFVYNGNIEYIFTSNALNNNVEYLVTKESDPSGGTNVPTKYEIKQDLINEFLSRDNLVTEYDLNTYFNQLIKQDLVNASNMKFIKKRDDVFKRCFAAFLLLRDNNGLIVPTNTIDFDYITDINEEFIIPSGTEICYDDNEYIVLTENTKYFLNSIKDRLEKILTDEDKISSNEDEEEVILNPDGTVNQDEVNDLLSQIELEDEELAKEDEDDNSEIEVDTTEDEEIISALANDLDDDNVTIEDEEEIVDNTYVDKTFKIYEFINDEYSYIKYNPKFDSLTFIEKDEETEEVKVLSFREKILTLVNEDGTSPELIVYKGQYRVIDEEEDRSKMKLFYKLPFSIYYKINPFQRLLMIKNTIDYYLFLEYTYISSNICFEFIINYMSVKRNSISFEREISSSTRTSEEDKDLTIKTIVTTNDIEIVTTEYTYDENGVLVDGPTIVDTEDTNALYEYNLSFTLNTTLSSFDIINNDKIIIRCLLKDSDGEYQGYFDFSLTESKALVFSKILTTDDTIDDHNRLNLLNCIYSLDEEYNYDDNGIITDSFIPRKNTNNEDEAIEEFFIDEETDIEICILVRDEAYNQTLPNILGKMQDLVEDNFSLAVKFENSANNKFRLFTVLNDVINPALVYRPSYYVEQGMQIQSLPVIGSHYFKTYEVYNHFFNIFDIYYNVLVDNFDKLENNTSVDIKFYNTYGYSKHFSSYTTNIEIELGIKLAGSFSTTLDMQIKNYIVAFVEAVNESTNKNFAISNLMRGLEKTFTDIEYVELYSLNGEKVQVIESTVDDISKMTREQLIDYIPEFLNIDMKEEAYIYGAEDFKTGINITYK